MRNLMAGPRAGVVVFKKDKILLMFRRKLGREYYVIPGGGIEKGETAKEAALRELKEEAGISANLCEGLCVEEIRSKRRSYYFFAKSFTGNVKLGGEELEVCNDLNFYKPEWVKLGEIEEIELFPSWMKDEITKIFEVIYKKNKSLYKSNCLGS